MPHLRCANAVFALRKCRIYDVQMPCMETDGKRSRYRVGDALRDIVKVFVRREIMLIAVKHSDSGDKLITFAPNLVYCAR